MQAHRKYIDKWILHSIWTSKSRLSPQTLLRYSTFSMASIKEMQALLNEQSAKKYYIEYLGYRSNHMAHGIIALYRLGASNARISEFAKKYSDRLEPAAAATRAGFDPEQATATKLSEQQLRELLGKREGYYRLLNHYTALLRKTYNGDLEEFIRTEFSKMVDGVHCAALHPLIHIGYGLNVRSETVVVEGMAYQHHSHIATKPVPPNPAGRTLDILEAVQKVRDSDIKQKSELHVANPDFMLSNTNGFLRKMAAVTSILRDDLTAIVGMIKLPDFEPSTATMEDVHKFADTVLHWAITVYACAKSRNDFFLLHGVTGAWALCQTLHAFDDPAKAFDCIEYFLAALLSVYVVQGCPAMNTAYLDNPPNCTLEDLREEALGKTLDEHVYKVVQVCYELGQTHKDTQQQTLYKVASRLAIDKDFSA